MKVFFSGKTYPTCRTSIRKAGYGEQTKRTGDRHYTKRLRGTAFPRFHVYLNEKEQGIEVSLHLDQKSACYGGTSAHSGEYDGPLVEREMERIAQYF